MLPWQTNPYCKLLVDSACLSCACHYLVKTWRTWCCLLKVFLIKAVESLIPFMGYLGNIVVKAATSLHCIQPRIFIVPFLASLSHHFPSPLLSAVLWRCKLLQKRKSKSKDVYSSSSERLKMPLYIMQLSNSSSFLQHKHAPRIHSKKANK